MPGKGRADGAIGQRDFGLLKLNLRRLQRGHARLDLTRRQRPGILDPAVATEQLIRFGDGNARQSYRKLLAPVVQLHQRRAALHIIASGEANGGHQACRFRI